MSYVPVPIIIPYDDEEEGEKVFFDIDENFDRVKARIDVVVKRAYGEDAYMTEESIKRDRKIRFNWIGAFIGLTILSFVLVFMLVNTNCIIRDSYRVCESNEYDVLWEQLFFPFGDEGILQLAAMGLCVLYVVISMLSFGYIIALKWNIATDYVKCWEITKSSSNTIISFTVDDNTDYLFEKEMMKEFPSR